MSFLPRPPTKTTALDGCSYVSTICFSVCLAGEREMLVVYCDHLVSWVSYLLGSPLPNAICLPAGRRQVVCMTQVAFLGVQESKIRDRTVSIDSSLHYLSLLMTSNYISLQTLDGTVAIGLQKSRVWATATFERTVQEGCLCHIAMTIVCTWRSAHI